MDPITLGYLGVATVVILVAVGVPIAFATAFTGIVGLIFIRGFDVAMAIAGSIPHAESAHYSLSVLPLFIVIGFLAMHAGITTSAFNAARVWVGRARHGDNICKRWIRRCFGRQHSKHRRLHQVGPT